MSFPAWKTRRKACARWRRNASHNGRTGEFAVAGSRRRRCDLTLRRRAHRLVYEFLQVRVEGKAVRIGRGPATVIGSRKPSARTPTRAEEAPPFARKGAATCPTESRGAFLLRQSPDEVSLC